MQDDLARPFPSGIEQLFELPSKRSFCGVRRGMIFFSYWDLAPSLTLLA